VADLYRALADWSLEPEHTLGCLALPPPLCDRDEAMMHMQASGMGLTAIARHFGLSRTRVEQILDRAEQRSDRSGPHMAGIPPASGFAPRRLRS
jgi:hypothetical protein